MSFTDTIKAALAKKHAAQHPDARIDTTSTKPVAPTKPAGKKPPKKVTGRGR